MKSVRKMQVFIYSVQKNKRHNCYDVKFTVTISDKNL